MEPLDIPYDAHVLVLTGAGISAESGVPTFRDMNGLWQGNKVEDVASPEGFGNNPELVWQFYSQRRAGLIDVKPNAGHYAIVDLERRMGDRFLLVTQNVDGLHCMAGSERVVELHGNIHRAKCSSCSANRFRDYIAYDKNVVPMCNCGAPLRPDIVWFGESLPQGAMELVCSFIEWSGEKLLFVAVGTSGNVYPAANMVSLVHTFGGKSLLVNTEQAANASLFDDVLIGKAGETLPILLSTK